MKRFALFLIFLLNTALLNSQSITVYDLDTSDYPVIRAKFFVFDDGNNIITDFDTDDFEVFENSSEREIISVSCPPAKPPTALSSVLTMDVSGSMQGYMLEKEKAAAKSWINGLPLGKSECAITSFDTKNNIIQDFTKDRNRLLDKIQLLGAGGGTDYEVGFIRPMAGGLLLAKTGTYKRVLVFLTDGRPNYTPDVSEIVDTALANNVVIYAVTLDMRCPRCLKDICIQTGGEWFENVTTITEARDIYVKIMQMTQDLRDPCEIEWKTKNRCFSGITDIEIAYKPESVSTKTSYYLPESKVEKLIFEPAGIVFLNKAPGETHDTTITVTAINVDFGITDIVVSNSAFEIKPSTFTLLENDSKTLILSYTPIDSSYASAEMEFVNGQCPATYYSSGSFPGQEIKQPTLKITHPDEREIFVAGSDTIVTWEGILPEDLVQLELSTNCGTDWELISYKTSGLTHPWINIPKTPSDQCLARVKHYDYGTWDSIPAIKWQKTFGGSSDEIAFHVKETFDNGYIMCGQSNSLDGDVGCNNGNYDFWILKLDESGNIQWRKNLGGTGLDVAYSIKQCYDGGYVVAGRTASDDGDVSDFHGYEDFLVFKLDTNGDVIWKNTIGGTGYDRAFEIIQTIDGAFFIVGESDSDDGDVLDNYGGADALLVKLDAGGNLLWNKNYGGSQDDMFNSIAQDYDGNILLIGRTESSDGDISSSHGGIDIWMIKIDNSGNIIWEKNIGGTNNEYSHDIINTNDSCYIVIGRSESNDGDLTENNGSSDICVFKIDGSANIKWIKSFGGTDYDDANAIVRTLDNGFIIAGRSGSNDGGFSNYGLNDYLLLKLSSEGDFVWSGNFGGSNEDFGYYLSYTNDYSIIMAGKTLSSDGDITSNNGNSDFWLVKLFPEGQVLQQDDSDTLFSIVMPEISSIDIDMGKVLVGTTKDSVITGFIKNTGSWECRIDSIYFQGADTDAFSLVSGIPQYIVASGDSHHAEFGFRPLKEGLHQAEIVVITQADTLIQNIQGEGIEPKLSVMCDWIDFGQVYLKEHKDTIKAIIENTGTASIEITKTEITGPDLDQFEIIDGGGSFTLNAGEERVLTLRFKPKYLGKTSTNLMFYHKEAGSPVLTQLYGEGIKKEADCDSTGFEYPDFMGVDDVILSGSTGRVDDFIRLTYANTSQAGAIWHEKPVPVGNGFITEFRFRLSSGNNENTDDGSSPGADGLAFVIQNNEGADLGLYGGGIGYHGIKNGLAVEFDLFMNNSKQIIDFKDPNGNHTAIQKTYGDKLSALHNSNNTIEINADIPELKSDGSIYYAKIEYNIEPNVMAVYLDETGALDDPVIVAGGIELEDIVDLEEGLKAFVGITSATGNAYQIHDLLDWYFCPFPVDITSVESEETNKDTEINIYPNPVMETASIEFNNSEHQYVSLSITDIFGREIINIFSGYKSPGNISFNWNTKDIGDGIYLCRLRMNNKNYVKSIIVSK